MSGSDFWSKRRAAVEAEQKADIAEAVAAEAAVEEAKLAERSDDELLAELDLPQPEELETPEAVREFMNSALPQRLKTRALRRLWRLNPVLANLDGLVDYGEDYTDAACVIENLQTAYQVGKGMLAHVEELARKAEAAEAAQDQDTEANESEADQLDASDEDQEVEDAPPLDPAPLELEPAMAALQPEPDLEASYTDIPASARRMRFQFDHAT